MTWLRLLPPSCLLAASLHHQIVSSRNRIVQCSDGRPQQQQQQQRPKARPPLQDQRLDDRVFLVAVRKYDVAVEDCLHHHSSHVLVEIQTIHLFISVDLSKALLIFINPELPLNTDMRRDLEEPLSQQYSY